jgi:hypothetical protein
MTTGHFDMVYRPYSACLSIYTYAQWVARHERPHVKQIARIANTLR